MPITQTQKSDDNGEVASSNTATATHKEKEVGKKPSPHVDVHEHELVGGVSSPIMRMRNPYLLFRFSL